jgi:hypothetical protein
MVKKPSDSITDYLHRVDVIMQEIADREEQELMGRLRALPAGDEEIVAFRKALRNHLEQKGMTVAQAHVEADRTVRFLLDNDLITASLEVRDIEEE